MDRRSLKCVWSLSHGFIRAVAQRTSINSITESCSKRKMMGLKHQIEEPEYILLYLVGGEDVDCDNSSASFEIEMKMDDEDVDFDSCQAHSTDGLSSSNSLDKKAFKWNDTRCLKFGPLSSMSVLKITLFKRSAQSSDSDGSRFISGDGHGLSAARVEYATASVPVEALRAAQYCRSTCKAEAEAGGIIDRTAFMKKYENIDRIIDMKILPMVGATDAVSGSRRAPSISPDSRIRAAEDAYHAALQAAIRGAHSQGEGEESLNALQIISKHDRIHSASRYFRLMIAYMIIPHTLCEDDCRNNTFHAITSEEGHTSETSYDQNLFYSVITEAIEKFHRGCNSTGQERAKHVPNNTCYVSYSDKNAEGNSVGGGVDINCIAAEPRNSSSVNRFKKSSDVRDSSVLHSSEDPSILFNELHSMCCEDSFLSNPEEEKYHSTNTARSQRPQGMFRKKEGEIPPRIFIEFLRHRVSLFWADKVKEFVEELKEGSSEAGDARNVLKNNPARVKDPNEEGEEGEEDVNITNYSNERAYVINKNRAGNLDLDQESIRIIDLLRDGAKVRCVKRALPGGQAGGASRLISPHLCHLITVTLAGTAEHSPSSSTMRRKSTSITIIRFLESAAIRFLVAVLAREGRMNKAVKDGGHTVGPVGPVNPSIQMIVQQSESHNIGTRIAELESMLLAAKVEEDSLRNILAPSTYLINYEEESLKGMKSNNRYTLEGCMSDLSTVRNTIHRIATLSIHENKSIQEKRSELHLVMQKINDMKFFCSRTSDLVFRSLCGAQKEGGHALVSSRSRVLSLHGKAGRINTFLEIDYSHLGEENVLSMTFRELLIVSKEIRAVEKVAMKASRQFERDISATEIGREMAVEEDLSILLF